VGRGVGLIEGLEGNLKNPNDLVQVLALSRRCSRALTHLFPGEPQGALSELEVLGARQG